MNIDDYYQKGRYDVVGDAAKAALTRFYEKRFKVIRRALQGYTFKKVLDAGCGDGEIGRLLKDWMHVDVYGIDISKRGVAMARKKGLKAKVADMSRNIPFTSNSFDLVISSATIEHVTNPDVFLKEIYRVLKPGCIALISTPNLSFWLNRVLFFMGLYPLFLEASTEAKVGYGMYKRFFYGMQLVGHIHVFTLPALKELLEYHKFSIRRVFGGTVDFVTPVSKVITFLYRTVDTCMTCFPSLSSDIIIIAEKEYTSLQK